MKTIGRVFLAAYRTCTRVRNKAFSLLAAGAFARFGRKTGLNFPVQLGGVERIALGERVCIGSGSWLQALPDGENKAVAISIGNGTNIGGQCVISSVRSVVLDENVLLARNVYISDHMHKYTETSRPVLAQGLDKIQPVLIKKGAWLGQNVVICPGVTVGEGSVIGANSVVKHDVPDFCIAAGAPARVVKVIAGWKKETEIAGWR